MLNFWHERNERLAKAREEGRAEGFAEGRAQGRAENRAAWTAWNSRRVEAEKRGERFDEPPPSFNER